MSQDDKTTVKELIELADKFRAERNWGKNHSAKNLAVSIAIEAAELMEKFQWDDYQDPSAKEEISDELADIIIYCLYLAKSNKIDISKSVKDKLKRVAEKYPKSIFKKERDEASDYWRIKKEHRGKS